MKLTESRTSQTEAVSSRSVILLILMVVIIASLAWYLYRMRAVGIAPLATELSYPGFQTFPTPRTFDAPGTIFRINRTGIRFPVVVLPVSTVTGNEAFASYRTTTNWKLSALIKWLSGRSVETSADDSIAVSAKVTLGRGMRERSFDQEIDQLLKITDIRFREDSRYFVIRETIAVPEITYEFGGSAQIAGKVKGSINDSIKGNANLSWTDNSKAALVEKFDQPYRIFFTVDELLPPGLGAGEAGPQRVTGPPIVTWADERGE